MMSHEERCNDLTNAHAMLVGKAFDELNEGQLQILLAYEYWKDGMDIDQVLKEFMYSEEKDRMSKAEVVLKLKSIFGYTFKTVI